MSLEVRVLREADKRLAEKIEEIKEEIFNVPEDKIQRHIGLKKGLDLARQLLADVDKQVQQG